MENAQQNKHKLFGLIGKNISYSFSRTYFSKKFEELQLSNCSYVNFDLENIAKFPNILKEHPEVKGMNVTIPYKQAVIPFLDNLNKNAKTIGAVNTIKITKKGKLKGYNTDYYGFKKSIEPFIKPNHTKALILGTGGASKAIAFALKKMGIDYNFVSRSSSNADFTYKILTKYIIEDHPIIINCTPLGTYPNIEDKPPIPYEFITKKHLLYDLIYNPEETAFLKLGKEKGAAICNGLKMLEFQAEKAWKIWNE